MDQKHLNYILLLLTFTFVSPNRGQADINLTMDYTNFRSSAPANVEDILFNDVFIVSTTDTERIDAAIGVMDRAAAIIEQAFAGTAVTINQTIDVGWDSHSGGTVATGGTSFDGSNTLTGGSLTWDNDTSTTFFADLTPSANEEYTASANDRRTIDFGGVDVNVEDRYYANFLGTAADSHTDMLSISLHELMHALGALDLYTPYANLDLGNDGDLDLMVDGHLYEVASTGGHTSETLAWDGPGSLPGTYYPNAIGISTVTGTRGLLTDLDTLVLAQIHGFDFATVSQPFNTIPVPEPVSATLLAVGAVACLFRRRAPLE